MYEADKGSLPVHGAIQSWIFELLLKYTLFHYKACDFRYLIFPMKLANPILVTSKYYLLSMKPGLTQKDALLELQEILKKNSRF